MSRRIGFRHCDPRFGFMWRSAEQPAGRWHGDGEGPANYFADTPVGAWAEFLRHEGIEDAEDLAGVRRSLWAVELPDEGYAVPVLAADVATGGTSTYAACQREARRLRTAGHNGLEATSAALLEGGASGVVVSDAGLTRAEPSQDGKVWVLFGPHELRGWIAIDGGSPPAAVLPLVRAMTA